MVRTYRTKFRMADFADFAIKIAPVVSAQDDVRQLLDRVSNQQVAFASEDEPLPGLIDQWLKDDDEHVNIDREITLANFGAELEKVAGSRPLPWERGNPKSFGQYFRNHKGTLAQLYGMTEREAHAGMRFVSFRHGRGGDLGALGERQPTHVSNHPDHFEKMGGLE